MNPYKHLSDQTKKGSAHQAAGVSVFRGEKEKVVWSQSGVLVDRNTLTLDGDVFEFVDLSTDSTFDVLTFWNNKLPEVQQVLAAHTFVVGDYVAVEAEIAKVISTTTGDVVGFKRGQAGTTIAAHSTGTDPIEKQEATALTAGAITIPTVAVTAEEGIDNAIAIVAELGTKGWSILKLSAALALVVSNTVGARAATFAEVMTNGTLLPATGEGGAVHGSMPVHSVYRAPTAAEVTDGAFRVLCPFKPINAVVTVFDDALGALVAWDGAVAYDHVANVATLDNGGAVDWAATDFVGVTVFGAPVAIGANVGA